MIQRIFFIILVLAALSGPALAVPQVPEPEPDPMAEDITFPVEYPDADWSAAVPTPLESLEPLSVTISLPKTTVNLGEKIPVTIVYKNLSASPIRVLKVNVWAHPLIFEVTDSAGRYSVISQVPRRTYPVDYRNDFVELAGGETLTQEMDLSQYFIFREPGKYLIRAVYVQFFGLPETSSNTVDVYIEKGPPPQPELP